MYDSWHSYPSAYALGHPNLKGLLGDPVLVEEKIDGSQFSFGVFESGTGLATATHIRCRSKGVDLQILTPEKMFDQAVRTAVSLQDKLRIGWTYRAEYLAKPKHNALAYDRIPKDHLILFDINIELETYLTYEEKKAEAERLGLEVVPKIFEGTITDINLFRELLDRESCLGGPKIEGVVIKNYHQFGRDKKILLGKFVSEAFKEVHRKEWKEANPTSRGIVENLGEMLRTPARWNKTIQHLKEAGTLTDSPQDIGLIMKEVPLDILKEEEDFIKEKLFQWAWPHLKRASVRGIPEWYKEKLVEKQFDHD